jgi:ribose 5-phosphate isomerase B
MKLGIASDHGGFELKQQLAEFLQKAGHDVTDFGAKALNNADDYPDYVIPLARAVAGKTVERGIAVCGSGVGASICACKIPGVRAALIHDHFSAHQGVEDDDMNVLCMGGRVIGQLLAEEIVTAFLRAEFTNAERHRRRLAKVAALEAR